jgi:hypothetical protein
LDEIGPTRARRRAIVSEFWSEPADSQRPFQTAASTLCGVVSALPEEKRQPYFPDRSQLKYHLN